MSNLDQRHANARGADVVGELERGREHYGRRAWADAPFPLEDTARPAAFVQEAAAPAA
jgi:hypothetical protein